MLSRRREQEAVVARHGRWIAQLRNDWHLHKQRLKTLELRLSALESHFTELVKVCTKLDVQISSANDWLLKLNSRIDALAGKSRGR
jgi:uncharacterized coiled-coil protein SlyX